MKGPNKIHFIDTSTVYQYSRMNEKIVKHFSKYFC